MPAVRKDHRTESTEWSGAEHPARPAFEALAPGASETPKTFERYRERLTHTGLSQIDLSWNTMDESCRSGDEL